MNISEIFGSHVFSETVMLERLPQKVYAEVQNVLAGGGQLQMETADVVAAAMMEWAIEHGATHYTHWFQQLTGITAEKHDSFLTKPIAGRIIEKLTGKQLIMGEPDASSFPSGGLRSTHYARGYTAWDITSPAFLKEESAGTILCIPTIFISYSGEVLDNKTPLLRSMEVLNTQALRIVRLFGDTATKRVEAMVGAEQEYFLVDREKFLKRRDLVYTGRTLFGAPAPKGQELEDQYFGVIRERVGQFMNDLNHELWKMGITATTQHNEVAPAQHEMAPIYGSCNVAVDQNQLTMETMKRVATRNGLVCLLHEKPYTGVNGSGKHNNWSLITDGGVNLTKPSNKPNEDTRFLLILSCILKAVDEHAGLIRQTAANVGNDLRLGADEAPPAIVSMFLGTQIEDVVHQIIRYGNAAKSSAAGTLNTGVTTMPILNQDATDRNRTSPFAFTGNKFEFRMVGSSDSISNANTVINTIVSEAFCEAADELEKSNDFAGDVNKLIARLMTKHKRIIFNGDGYAKAWVEEAERRGMPNLRTMLDAIPELTTEKTVNLFERFGVFSRAELVSREEILYETYSKIINIEAQTMVHMAGKHYIPAAIQFTTRLAQSINEIMQADPKMDVTVQRQLLEKTTKRLVAAQKALLSIIHTTQEVNSLQNAKDMAKAFQSRVVPEMEALRQPIDEMELMVGKDIWPLDTYGDLMFEL